MTAMKWVLLCGLLNAAAFALVVFLGVFTEIAFGTALAFGAAFVVAALWPFVKAQKAHAAQRTSEDPAG